MFMNEEYANIQDHKSKVENVNRYAWQFQKQESKSTLQTIACNSKVPVVNKYCKCS